jgi:hypothetical protein
MRIKKNPLSFTHSAEFEQIIIVPNTEENMNMVILIPKNEIGPRVNMFQLVRQTLNVSY